jgi:hypothetical protein
MKLLWEGPKRTNLFEVVIWITSRILGGAFDKVVY